MRKSGKISLNHHLVLSHYESEYWQHDAIYAKSYLFTAFSNDVVVSGSSLHKEQGRTRRYEEERISISSWNINF